MQVREIARPDRTPPSEPPHPCERCGERTVPAFRHETGRAEPVPVRWCRDGCGQETPPLYRRMARAMPRPTMRLACVHCDAPFVVEPAKAATRRYCSRACAVAARAVLQEPPTVDCDWCHRPLTPKQAQKRRRYCSRSHAASANNVGRILPASSPWRQRRRAS